MILSVGGNDALMKSEILNAPVRSTSEALCMFADIAAQVEENYRLAVDACRRATLPLCLCTIYNGCFADPSFQRTVTTALKIFNDAILRFGFELKLPMIDLRFCVLLRGRLHEPDRTLVDWRGQDCPRHCECGLWRERSHDSRARFCR